MTRARNQQHGFTIVEILVVIAVLAILTTIITVSTTLIQQQSRTSAAQSIAEIVYSGAERYYAKNGEYPLAPHLHTPQLAASALGTTPSTLESSGIEFRAYTEPGNCTGTCASTHLADTTKVYYFTRYTQSSTASVDYELHEGCTIRLVNGTGAVAFVIAYYDETQPTKKWTIKKHHAGPGRVNIIAGTQCTVL